MVVTGRRDDTQTDLIVARIVVQITIGRYPNPDSNSTNHDTAVPVTVRNNPTFLDSARYRPRLHFPPWMFLRKNANRAARPCFRRIGRPPPHEKRENPPRQSASWLGRPCPKNSSGRRGRVSRLREIFQGAIRFFLRRALSQHKLESRQKEVFDILIKNLREISIDNPNRLASDVLTLLRQYINSHITASPHLVSVKESNANARVGAIKTMLANIAALDKRGPCADIMWTKKQESKSAGY
jgi:hypothetical protein